MVCQVTQMVEASDQSTYLGLPNMLERSKSALLGYLKDRANTRINSWYSKYISRAGKKILIKSVAQALPTYAMNVFLLPAEIPTNIERALTKYWWKTSQSTNSHLNWMSWDRLTKHKSSGGLGFKNFRDFNIAMLGKQGWRFMAYPHSLATRLYKARYFSDTDFLNSKLGSNPSFIWRSIFEAKSVLAERVRWQIGTGKIINILGQPWLSMADNPSISTVSRSIEDKKVSSVMKMDTIEWDIDLIRDVFNDRDQKCILDISLDESTNQDTLYWRHEVTRVYSVKSAHKRIQSQKGREDGIRRIKLVSGQNYVAQRHHLRLLIWYGVHYQTSFPRLLSCRQNGYKFLIYVQFAMKEVNRYCTVWFCVHLHNIAGSY